MRLERGTVVLVDLDPTVGHEQKSVCPCVVSAYRVLDVASMEAIDEGLRLFLGLGPAEG